MNDTREHPAPDPRKRRGWVWPAIIFGFIALQIGMSLTALALAVGDPAQAVVPDYYAKAVDWDAHRAELAASDSLGWTARFKVTAPSGPLDEQIATIRLADADGSPVIADVVVADVFHHARASQVQKLTFTPTAAPGEYAAKLRMLRPGNWQIDLTARRGSDTFIKSLDQIILGGDG